jgi:glucokinase
LLDAADGDPEGITGRHISDAAALGDKLARKVVKELGHWIGHGAGSVDALLDTELFVIGGGVAEIGDLLLDSVRKAYKDRLSAFGHRPEAQIELALFGNDAGVIGAAELARI